MQEIALGLVVMLALVYAIYAFGITPKKAKLIDLDKQLEELTKEAETIEAENQALKKTLDEQKQAELASTPVVPVTQVVSKNPRVQILQGKLRSDYTDVSDFLSALTKPEFHLTLEIQSLSYSDPKRENGYISTRFTLIARGSFGTTVDFIEKLENVKALMGIDKINIDVDKTDTRNVTLELIGTFYKLEDENV